MPLRDVAELVRQHRGQLVPAADHAQQAQVQAEVAPRQGEGVDRAVAPHEDLPGKGLVQLRQQFATLARRRQQGLPDALHIVR